MSIPTCISNLKLFCVHLWNNFIYILLKILKLGNFAVGNFAEYIENPTNGSFHFQSQCHANINSQKYTSALARATSAIKENPTDPIPHSYKGISLYHLGKFNEAILYLDAAIKLDPNNSVTIYNLGLAYMASKNTEEAISQFEKAVSLNPSLKHDIELTGALEDD